MTRAFGRRVNAERNPGEGEEDSRKAHRASVEREVNVSKMDRYGCVYVSGKIGEVMPIVRETLRKNVECIFFWDTYLFGSIGNCFRGGR